METTDRKKQKPDVPVEVVGLYRAGSGAHLVNGGSHSPFEAFSPFSHWCEQLGLLATANYGEMQVVISAPSVAGYDGYPGCVAVFLPGNKDGVIRNVQGKDVRVREPLPAVIGRVHSFTFPGSLSLEFGFKDLMALHTALGKIMEYNVKVRKVE